MLLKPRQLALFWRLWSDACATQGWIGDEKELRRHEVLENLGFSSLKLVDPTSGFDRVKHRLMALSYRLEGGAGLAFPDIGDMRRHLHLIESDVLPRLAALVESPDAYVDAICRDKFGHSGPWRSLADHPDRGPNRVIHLLMTLKRAMRRLEASQSDKPLRNRPQTPHFGQNAPRRTASTRPRWSSTS